MLIDQTAKWSAIIWTPAQSFGPIDFTLFLNRGIIFSLAVPRIVYLPIALAVFAVFLFALFSAVKYNRPTVWGLALIVFGAVSNLADRLIHGATIDYLVFFNRSAVNLADGMILLGVLMFIWSHKKVSDIPSAS
ncbi:MAG: signal peptidase II [Patescibacteria group bacterium]